MSLQRTQPPLPQSSVLSRTMHPVGQGCFVRGPHGYSGPHRATQPSPSMTLRALCAFAAIAFAAACGEDDPTSITAGERMSAEEQVAIGPALEKAARALDSTHRAEDTLLADAIRVGAALVSRQGQQGLFNARLQPRGGAVTTLDMRAISARAETGVGRLHLILAWEGLDVAQLRADRVLVLLFSGTIEEGNLPGLDGILQGRWIDFTSGEEFPDPYLTTSGTATISGGSFGGACPGVPDTEEFTCTTGRETVLADVTVERQAHILDIDWDAVVLPSFRIVGSGLLP